MSTRLRTLYALAGVAAAMLLWGVVITILSPLLVFVIVSTIHSDAMIGAAFYGSIMGEIGLTAWLAWTLGVRVERRLATEPSHAPWHRRVLWAVLIVCFILDTSAVVGVLFTFH
jgi:hypothetical protein